MPQVRRRASVLLPVGLVLLALFSVAGYITAGSLQGSGYRTAAKVYLGVFAVSVLALVGVLIWRKQQKRASRPVI
jgi:hypothetical protein